MLWDFSIQYDHIIEARRPHILIMEKDKKVCKIINIAIPGDSRVSEKESEKVKKYQDLKREITTIWSVKKVEMIPFVVGPLGTIPKRLDKWTEKIGIKIKTEHIQKTAILGGTKILRKVPETRRELKMPL